MTENKRRISHRLHDFDYSQPGAYFITIVTFKRAYLFGEIKDGVMISNAFGDIARWEWECLPKRFPFIQVDEFNVMPNHTHAIIVNNGDPVKTMLESSTSKHNGISVGARREDSSAKETSSGASPRLVGPRPHSLGIVIASYKAQVANKINHLRRKPGHPVWQRDYYDHIIRDETDWANSRLYIQTNPENWVLDDENRPSKI